jgi:Family of unknown function (DUF5677)
LHTLQREIAAEGLAGARLSVLIGTAMKAINTSNAIRMLCVERPYFEEMYILVRTLIESIVNGAFIQIADDDGILIENVQKPRVSTVRCQAAIYAL